MQNLEHTVGTALQHCRLGYADTVFAVEKLYDGAIAVAYRQIVVRDDSLEMLDETALQVAGSRRLHCRIDEALAPRHRRKEVLLRPHAVEKALIDKAARARCPFVRPEGRQGASR